MKKIEPADPLLDEVEAAQRKLEAEFGNDPAKLLAHYRKRRSATRTGSSAATWRATSSSKTDHRGHAETTCLRRDDHPELLL